MPSPLYTIRHIVKSLFRTCRRFITRGMGQLCQARAEDFYKWPTCEMHYDLATSFTNFYSWVWESL